MENDYTGLKNLKGRDILSSISKILKSESSSDHKVITEIFQKKVYDPNKNPLIEPNEKWLDLGANIGAFALYCLMKGATPICYEPNMRNFKKLSENLPEVKKYQQAVSTFNGMANLYLESSNNWRHTLKKIRGRNIEEVEVININDVIDLHQPDGIKLDIEGSELEVIKNISHFPKKLVFEYDGQINKHTKDYYELIELLKSKYQTVIYQELKGDVINFFPNGFIVIANNRLEPF